MAKTDLTAQRLRELFHYDQDSGVFKRRIPRGNSTVGDVAGSRSNRGYVQFWIDGRHYKAHRLAWLYVHGEWPKDCVDHINGVIDDNRIANLRDVSRSENLQNQRKAHTQNTHGFMGVTRHNNRTLTPWSAKIRVDGKRRTIGYFATPELAHAAYIKEKRLRHPGCMI